MLFQERQLGEAKQLPKRAAYMTARMLLGVSLLTACLQGEQKPPSPTIPGNISSEPLLLTSDQMRQRVRSEVFQWPKLPDIEQADIEQALMSPQDRAWEIRGIKDFYLILEESINPAFQDPSLTEQLGQNLTPLSAVDLVRLQSGPRYFNYIGSRRFSGWEITETQWGTFSLRGEQGPSVFVRVFNGTFPDGSAGELRRYIITVDLANNAVPEFQSFIEKKGRNRMLNPNMLKEAASEFFQLPEDLQWELGVEEKQPNRPTKVMLGRGTSSLGKISVKVNPDGTADLKVVRNPS